MEGKGKKRQNKRAKKEKEVVEAEPEAEDEMEQEEESIVDEDENEIVNEDEDGSAEAKAEDEEEEEEDESANWESLGLEDRLVAAAKRQGWDTPSPVQEAAIPLALAGRDLLVRARTGSGKTAAYSLPLIHGALMAKELPDYERGVRAVVLVPTRELCQQVRDHFVSLTHKYCPEVTSLALSADVPFATQKARLTELPDILVATPKVLLDHLKKATVVLKDSVQAVVVDEADFMLSYGFEEDMKQIVQRLPAIFQGFLMSATLSTDVENLKQLILHSPAVLKLEDVEDTSSSKLTQHSIECSEGDKFLLAYFMVKMGLLGGKGIFFVNDIDRCFKLKLFFERFFIKAALLNSELPQNSRYHILQQFNKGVFDYLIATDEHWATSEEEEEKNDEGEDGEEKKKKNDDDDGDEEENGEEEEEEDGESSTKAKRSNRRGKKAKKGGRKGEEYGVSRGVDFKDVSAVVNFDFPRSVKAYVHRVGRTARGSASGMALSFVTPDDADMLEQVAAHLESEGREVTPYSFKMSMVEGFRYRVEDTLRSVTRASIKEARVKELKAEILNSQQLKEHFSENQADLKLLMEHDRTLLASHVKPHLKYIPTYLMPGATSLDTDGTVATTKAAAPPRNLKRKRTSGKEKSGANPLKSLKFKGKQGNQRDAMEDKANPALNPSLEPGSRIHNRILNKAFARKGKHNKGKWKGVTRRPKN